MSRIKQTIHPTESLPDYTIELSEREYDLLLRVLNVVEIPAVLMEDRTRFWELYTSLTLARNDYLPSSKSWREHD